MIPEHRTTIDITELLMDRQAERARRLEDKVIALSGRLGAIKKLCELALEDRCHKGSNQARRLQAAIEKAGEP